MEKNASPAIIQVAAPDAGRRVDNFLITRLKGVPRSRIYRMIRGGEVRVNGGRIKPDGRLAAGDRVRVPPLRMASQPSRRGPPARRVAELRDRVLFADPYLLVIDKPAGLAVHGGSGVSWGVIELLRAAEDRGGTGLELVHRLDRDTSGCLLLARRRSALRELHRQFREGGVRKEYVALLCGRLAGRERLVDQPLATRRRGGERFAVVDAAGRPARSRFLPRRRYADFTLADVLIETGRTHQIRAHAAHIGHPVAGDLRYGDEATQRRSASVGLQRLFLHAAALTFDHPRDGRVIRVEAPLDASLASVLGRLRAD